MNQSINSVVEAAWKCKIESKPSLKYVNPDSMKVWQSHPVWSTVRCNNMDNKRAQLKCKLLTGTYILQGNRAVFNQHSVDPTCKLCTIAPETRQHFIAECPAFVTERCELTEKLLRNQVLSDVTNEYVKKKTEILTQLMLDASVLLKPCESQSEALNILELQSREFLYKIHQKRFVFDESCTGTLLTAVREYSILIEANCLN